MYEGTYRNICVWVFMVSSQLLSSVRRNICLELGIYSINQSSSQVLMEHMDLGIYGMKRLIGLLMVNS